MNESIYNRLASLIITSLFLLIGIVLLKGASVSEMKQQNQALKSYTIHEWAINENKKL